jgi:hypothetical protein
MSPVRDVYSKRARREAGVSDVFQYDVLPDRLRNQIVHIWDDALGDYKDGWRDIARTVAREHGLPHLGGRPTIRQDCEEYREIFSEPLARDPARRERAVQRSIEKRTRYPVFAAEGAQVPAQARDDRGGRVLTTAGAAAHRGHRDTAP